MDELAEEKRMHRVTIEAFKEQLARAEKAEAALAEAEKRISERNAEVRALYGELAEAQGWLRDAKVHERERDVRISELEEKLALAEGKAGYVPGMPGKRIAELEAKLAAAVACADQHARRIASLEADLEDMTAQFQFVEKENARLKAALQYLCGGGCDCIECPLKSQKCPVDELFRPTKKGSRFDSAPPSTAEMVELQAGMARPPARPEPKRKRRR